MDEPKQSIFTSSRLRILIPLVVFVVALGIRLIGIGWGLKNDLHNQSYHPDEEVIFGFSQAIEPGHFKFTPGSYNYGTLYLTVLRVASDMTAAYTGGMDPKSVDSVWSYVARCNMAGRLISAFAGAGTVLIVFLIVRRFSTLLGASAAAAILAFAPAHVVHSRFQTVDVFAVLLLAASVLCAFKFLPLEGEDLPEGKSALKWIILSGAFAGLSGGTKYTGILTLLTLLVVLLAYRRATFLKDAAIAVGSCLVAFVVATPGVLLDNAAFMRDFSYEMQHTSEGHGIAFTGTANGFVYHFGNLLQGFGTIATVIGLAALLYGAFRRKIWAIALLAFIAPYYFLIGRAEVKFMRYTFPLYVGLAAGFGWAVAKGQEQKGWGRGIVAAGILAVGGVDYGGLIGTARYTGYMVNEDPRDAAARYLKNQSKAKPNSLVGLPEDPWFWSAPLFLESTANRGGKKATIARWQEMDKAIDPRVTFYRSPDGNPTQWDTRLMTELKPDFVTYSSLEYDNPERLLNRTDISGPPKAIAEAYKQFLTELQAGYSPDLSFGEGGHEVEDMAYVQPKVVIWKRKPTP